MNKKIIKSMAHYFVLSFIITMLVRFIVFVKINTLFYENELIQRFEMIVFLDKDVPAPEVAGEKIRSIKSIKTVAYYSREQVKEKFAEVKNEVLIAGENPFPDTFNVQLYVIDTFYVEDTINQINAINGISEIKYDAGLLSLVEKVRAFSFYADVMIKIVLIAYFVILLFFFLSEFMHNKKELLKRVVGAHFSIYAGLSGIAIAVFVIILLKKLILPGNVFIGLPLKWYFLIVLTGLSSVLMELLHGKEK